MELLAALVPGLGGATGSSSSANAAAAREALALSGRHSHASGWVNGIHPWLLYPGIVNASSSQFASNPLLLELSRKDLGAPLQHGVEYRLSVMAVSGTGRTCAAMSPPFVV